MYLYLVQHVEAIPEEIDPKRPITEKGRKDVEKVAQFLKGKVKVPRIYHSPKLRAIQTAEVLKEIISPEAELVQREGVAPKDPIFPLVDEIHKISEDLMIVGHLPFLGKLISYLLTGDEDRTVVGFRQGGCVALRRDREIWQIEWVVVPSLLE